MIMRRREAYASERYKKLGEKVEKRMEKCHHLVKRKMGKKLRKIKKNLERAD